MAEFRLAPKAEDDLEDIWLFGFGKWGQLQADKYAGELHAKFVALAAAAPAAGVPCDHIKPGYRRSFVGRHHIYFRNKPYGIDIMRILHGAMNITAHL